VLVRGRGYVNDRTDSQVYLYDGRDNQWYPVRNACDLHDFQGSLLWTDYGAVLWHLSVMSEAPLAWLHEGPFP
jgi:hypothetical protein